MTCVIQEQEMQEASQVRGGERHARLILGMRVDATSYDAAQELVLDWASREESRYVCEAPIHMVMESYDSSEYQNCINHADLVTPGGMPIVWFMRLLGVRRQPRVYGPELMLHLCAAAARNRVPVGLFGSTDEVVRDLAANLQKQYPGLPIVYIHAPPFRAFTDDEDAEICREIASSGCRILFVGMGCPRQERWMARHRGRVAAVMVGVGAAFDFISGHKPQAPRWLRQAGGEWLFRFITEPRRLWYRYAYHNPRFVALAVRQLLQHWRIRNHPG